MLELLIAGTVTLGSLKGRGGRASVVSGDGNVIAGWDSVEGSGPWYGAIWWQGLQRLMNPFAQIGQVEGMNDSGSVIVGRGHPSNWRHAYRFTNLANVYVATGRYDKAGEACSKALPLLTGFLGPDHAEVAATLQILARTRQGQQRYGEAADLLRQALEIELRHPLAAALGVSTDDISCGHAVPVQHMRGNGPQCGRST